MRLGEYDIKPDSANIEKLRSAGVPKYTTGAKRVLGLLAFYARFYSSFANRAEPVVKLTRKGEPFAWGREQMDAVKSIIDDIESNALTLPDYDAMVHPDPEKRRPCILCRCEQCWHRAWLGQRDKNGVIRTLAFESKTFDSAQRNWDTCSREYFGSVWSVNKFRVFLEVAFTDNSALVPILAKSSLTRKSMQDGP